MPGESGRITGVDVSGTAETIAQIVQHSCIDLFSSYAVDIGPRSHQLPLGDLALCGVIGFTGEDMRGSLMLGCSEEPLRLARHAHVGNMRDWLGELTNQLLGRVKNQLVPFGLVIHSSTPTVLGGERIAPIGSQSLGHLFTANGGVVSVWFDAEMRPGLVLTPGPDGLRAELEGHALLF